MKRLIGYLFAVVLLAAAADLGAQSASPGRRFVDNGDGTVTDARKGLMWEKKPPTRRVNWTEALAYCDELFLGRYSDWRIPLTMELEEITTSAGDDSAAWLNANGFSDVQVDYYWSFSGFKDGILVCVPGACDPPGYGLVWAVRAVR